MARYDVSCYSSGYGAGMAESVDLTGEMCLLEQLAFTLPGC